MPQNSGMSLRSTQSATPRDASGRASTFQENVVLAERGKRRIYRKGTILIEEGDTGESVFIILSGRVKVFSTDADDHEITYAMLGAGDYFGEMSLDGGPRSASVITMEPTECSVVGRAEVRAYMAENPDFAYELLVTAIRRAREATRIARGLALGDVYSRLVAFLTNAAKLQTDGVKQLEERLTQQEIASRIGCGREMVSRILKDLKLGGYVSTRDRRILVLKKLPDHW